MRWLFTARDAYHPTLDPVKGDLPRPLMFRHHCTTVSTDSFCSGDREIDTWFRKKSRKDHDNLKHIVTCLCFADAPEKPVGFYALSTVVEEVKVLPGISYRPSFGSIDYFPCLRLVYVAVEKGLQGQGIGTVMMGKITNDFADIGEAIGLPLLILTPANDRAARFYSANGFDRYRRGTGMYLPLESAIEARDRTI